MSEKKSMGKVLFNGIIPENPTFRLVLGTCPTLAVTTSAINGLGMGAAATFVLICSNLVISLLRKFIPDQVRIPAFIVVICTFVTMVQLLMQAFIPSLYEALGIFIPLIVVNCIILGRAESFASKNRPAAAALDGLCQGIGYTIALVLMCVVREFLGNGTFGGGILNGGEGIRIIPEGYPAMMMVMPVGGFLTLGFLMAAFQWFTKYLHKKKAEKEAAK